MTNVINMGLLACLAAFLCVTMATLVLVDFIGYVSARYREKYLQQAAVELDDVLLQIPANKILDVSLASSAFIGFLTIMIIGVGTKWTWGQAAMVGILLAIIAFFIPRVVLRILRKIRMNKFNNQLEDALSSISSSLKAGFSINQALETIVDENIYPISVEFRLLVQEIRLGVSLDEALDKMVNRIDSPDFELVATAIVTARQTGGELTAILDRLAAMIRERMRITNKLHAMTAQGRLQAMIIGLMPVLLLVVMTWMTPKVMNDFYTSGIGILCLAGCALMVITGFLVIRKILTIDI